MWTALVTIIQKVNRDEELDRFLTSVREAGICVTELEPEGMYGLPGDENLRQPFVAWEALVQVEGSQGILVLTDIPCVADKVKQMGIALLGLEWKNSGRIYAAPYIMQTLDGIDADYLGMVYKRFHGEPLIIAKTERLCIRELVCEDAEVFMRLGREAGFTLDTMTADAKKSKEDVQAGQMTQAQQEFLQAYIDGQYALYGYGIWALTDRENGELLGIAGVEDRVSGMAGDDETYLELGYAIEEKWRGRGLAREACLAIIEYLVQELELTGKIKCFVPKGNIASQKTAQSIGMLQTKEVFDEFYCYERIL